MFNNASVDAFLYLRKSRLNLCQNENESIFHSIFIRLSSPGDNLIDNKTSMKQRGYR